MDNMNENELENVKAGLNLSYEEAKASHKFTSLKDDKKEEEITELSEEELEKYMGGINMDAYEAEKYTKSR